MSEKSPERIIQICPTPHGTIYALTDRGGLFEQTHDPRPASSHVDARNPYRLMWRKVAGPDFSASA